jgi:hypothetical protein
MKHIHPNNYPLYSALQSRVEISSYSSPMQRSNGGGGAGWGGAAVDSFGGYSTRSKVTPSYGG